MVDPDGSAPGRRDLPSFGGRLRRLREAAGLTQEDLAWKAGVTPKAVSVLERGERQRPYPRTVRALADTLQLSDGERAALLASVPSRSAGVAGTSAPASASGLPAQLTPLIGREKDGEAASAILLRRETRLLTLIGPGGVGKTRLAIDVAARSAPGFSNGATFVALASLRDPELVVTAILAALEVREGPAGTARDALAGYLRGREMLLVLDNFEHVMPAAEELPALLASSPGVSLLVTSRAPLRLRGEREWLVPPLAVPDPSRPPDLVSVAASPAAQLFLQRARDASSPSLLTRQNAASVAAICWRLDGLPLALELVATQARLLCPTELLSRLDQALETAGARDLPERQRTMQATLDWSHDLLSPEQRTLFRRLSVFAGGFALESAEAVGVAGDAGAETVLALLGALVEQSLITVRSGADGSELRYAMLEPIRQYALDKLTASGEEPITRSRHAAYFAALAERAGPELKRDDQAAWLTRLALEHDNLRSALSWLLSEGEAPRVARIGWEIHRFWSLRGFTGEGREWMERALSHGDELDESARARALYVVAMLSYVQGELERTAEAVEASIGAARAGGDPLVLAVALLGRALTTLALGDLPAAERELRDALVMLRAHDARSEISLGLGALAQVTLGRGDAEGSDHLLDEAEAMSRSAADWFSLTACLSYQALAARLRGDDRRAAELLRESVALAGELGDAWHVVYGLTGLAGVAAGEKHGERAARLFGAAEKLCDTMGVSVPTPAWLALTERDLSSVRQECGKQRFEAALAEGRAQTLSEAVAEAVSYP